MNKLLSSLLFFSFIYLGTAPTCFIYFALILSKIIMLDFITLSVYTILLTYYVYGLFGVFYLLVSTSILVLCGIMYWYELSVNDIKHHMIKYAETDSESIELNKQITEYHEFINNHVSFLLQKINITESKLNILNNYYNHMCSYLPTINKYYTLSSSYYDKIFSATYGYMKQLRGITSDVPLIKYIYYVYDKIVNNIMNIESLRFFHKISRNMHNAMNSLDPLEQSEGSSSSQNLNIKNNESDIKPDIKSDNISDQFAPIDSFFSNMKPQEMEFIMKQVFNSDMFNNMDNLDEQFEPSYSKVIKKKK